MFGVTFEGNRDPRRIYMPPDYTSFPLRKDFFLPDDAARSPGAGVQHMERTLAPTAAPPEALVRRARARRQPPATHGVLRVVLKLDGERVVDLDPVLGYLHRGVEKLCENADYHQAICYTDPLEYVSSLFTEGSPVIAFEKLMDVQVPRRAEYIRVLS